MEGFDAILEDVDSFGTYQRLLLFFVLLPGFIPCGFHAYNQLFMAATPDHWCHNPAFANFNLTTEEIKNITIPYGGQEGRSGYSQCSMYDIDSAGALSEAQIWLQISHQPSQSQSNLSTYPIVPCKYGWEYDLSLYSSTVVTQWDIVCDRSFYPTLALVLLGLGGLVGNYVFGNIQDSLGRRPAFFIYLSIQCFFGIATGFAFDFWSWLITRIGVGFTVPAITGTPFVLALELVGPSERTLCTILLNISYSLCLMGLAVVAYLVRDWRAFAFATVLPFITFFSFWWILPESPRWLFAHGKLEETEKILRQMAHVNGKALPADYRKRLQEKYAEAAGTEKAEASTEMEGKNGKAEDSDPVSEDDYGISDLLRGPVLRRNTIIITFIWFINLGVYVGLSYYAPILGGDEYLNFFLAGAAELPTYFFLLPCLDNWGRRWTLFASMFLGGVACICTILVQQEAWVTLTLYCVGKFGISAAFVAIQQIASEIYPTVVRGRGISFSTVVGMIGPVFVPLVNYTGQEYLYLPLLTLGGLMVVGGVAALGLPETLGRSLPQTLMDAEEFSMDFSLESCCPSKKKTIGKGKEKKETGSYNSSHSNDHSDNCQEKESLAKTSESEETGTKPGGKKSRRTIIIKEKDGRTRTRGGRDEVDHGHDREFIEESSGTFTLLHPAQSLLELNLDGGKEKAGN